jgi:hypothetical protein
VADFNERQSIVETSRQALTIAEETYAQTLQRFIRAQANAYFHLRRLTLYDYQHNKSITYSCKK